MAEAEDRTLPASEKRRQRAREDGQAPLSREVVNLAALGAAGAAVAWGAAPLAMALSHRMHAMLRDTDAGPEAALRRAGAALLWAGGPLLLLIAAAATAAVLLQTRGLLHGGALRPDPARLSPARGLRRIAGPEAWLELLKSVAKAALVGWAAYAVLRGLWPDAAAALSWTPGALLAHIGEALRHLLVAVIGCQLVVALADLVWVRLRFDARLRMSRQEVLDETKEAEGDPQHKAKLRALRRARARRRMLAAVPKATVVVTNPTHYAVALAYQRGTQAAPRVVAKGVDDVAARIRAAAAEHRVPIVAQPPLARALYRVELDAEVPAEHFKAVAEIIAYVWRLRAKAKLTSNIQP